MDLNPDEVRIKGQMAEACDQVIAIIDGTKWHRSALLSFVPHDQLYGIVTDETAPDDQVEAWRARGVEVVVAEIATRPRSPIRPVDLRRAPPGNGEDRS